MQFYCRFNFDKKRAMSCEEKKKKKKEKVFTFILYLHEIERIISTKNHFKI
jgi:hypothetical protein